MKLNVKAVALAAGLIWGFGLFVITWWIIFFEGASGQTNILTQAYRGYSITPMGSVIGLIWGLLDGMLGGAFFAWLYNLIAKGSLDQA